MHTWSMSSTAESRLPSNQPANWAVIYLVQAGLLEGLAEGTSNTIDCLCSLLGRSERRLALKHILIATDGSELAGKAVAEGIQFAEALGAHITFLTVTSPLATLGDQGTAFGGLPEAVRGQALAYLAADADRTLSAALAEAKTAGVGADSLKLENRQPHEAITAAAKSIGADMILMASHGRSGIKAVLLGSVTQKVLTHSELPVLVCRGADQVASRSTA